MGTGGGPGSTVGHALPDRVNAVFRRFGPLADSAASQAPRAESFCGCTSGICVPSALKALSSTCRRTAVIDVSVRSGLMSQVTRADVPMELSWSPSKGKSEANFRSLRRESSAQARRKPMPAASGPGLIGCHPTIAHSGSRRSRRRPASTFRPSATTCARWSRTPGRTW